MGVHDGHRSRMKERFRGHGLENFNDINALELLLFYAAPRRDTNGMAHALLERFGSFSAVLEANEQELLAVPGIGENAVTLLRLIPEVSRRYLLDKTPSNEPIDSAEAAGTLFHPAVHVRDGGDRLCAAARRAEASHPLRGDKPRHGGCRRSERPQARRACAAVPRERRHPRAQPPQRRGAAFRGGRDLHGAARPRGASICSAWSFPTTSSSPETTTSPCARADLCDKSHRCCFSISIAGGGSGLRRFCSAVHFSLHIARDGSLWRPDQRQPETSKMPFAGLTFSGYSPDKH